MSGETITMTVEEDGNTTIDMNGFKGGACRQASDAIEEALGRVGARQMKAGGGCEVKQTVTAKG